MTDQSQTGRQNGEGYYGCSLPPGGCECPQSTRHNCSHAHWIATQPTRGDAEGACPNCESTAPDHDFGCYRAPPKPAPDAMRQKVRQILQSRVRLVSIAEDIEPDIANIDEVTNLILAAISFAPVPPADGALIERVVRLTLSSRLIQNIAGNTQGGPVKEREIVSVISDVTAALLPSGAGAAEPVAQMLEYARRLNDIAVDVELAQGGLGGAANASDLRRIAQQIVATPPVRRGRQLLAETIHKARFPSDRTATSFADEHGLGREYCFQIADAILSLRV